VGKPFQRDAHTLNRGFQFLIQRPRFLWSLVALQVDSWVILAGEVLPDIRALATFGGRAPDRPATPPLFLREVFPSRRSPNPSPASALFMPCALFLPQHDFPRTPCESETSDRLLLLCVETASRRSCFSSVFAAIPGKSLSFSFPLL